MDKLFVEELEKRRSAIVGLLETPEGPPQRGDALLLFSAVESRRNGDVDHSYRQHSDFYYLTGFEEPDSVLFLCADEPKMVLFVREKDRERETWEGRRAGVEGALADFGAVEAHPISELAAKLPDLLENRKRVHYLLGEESSWDQIVFDALAVVRKRRKKRVDAPSQLIDARVLLHEARLHKTPFEQKIMAKAAGLSADGHREAMRVCKPGMNEWELQTTIETCFRVSGARRLAYGSIVGSGKNGTILHYQDNSGCMASGDLVLIDAGAELNHLAADITRTFPVSGQFTPVQKRLYEIVLRAQLAAIKKAKAGNTLEAVHHAATALLQEGLISEGLMDGIDLKDQQAVEARLKHFYMHQTSHYLGMDVHDVGTYHRDGQLRPLEVGMAITVEPGLYIASDDTTVPEEYRGIGIRIEDDLLVTDGEPHNLSHAAPKTVAEVEAACAS